MDGRGRIAIAFATPYAKTLPASSSSQTIACLLVSADRRRRGAGAARRNRAIERACRALSAQSTQSAQRLRTEYPATSAREKGVALACEAQYWNLWLSGR